MKEIADKLLEISSEPVRKRRQTLFYSIYEKYEGVLHPIISLSLVLKGSINVTPKENFSEKYTSFSNFLGKLVYFYINDEKQLLIKEIKRSPKDWQVIAQWIFSDKFRTALTSEYLFTILPNVLTLEELNNGFIKIPEYVDTKNSRHTVVLSDEPEKISYPFYFVRISTKIRQRGTLRYWYKDGEDIITNVTSKVVKDYLEDTFLGKFKIGVILVTATEKLGSHKWNIQPIIVSEDVDMLKKLYKGHGSEDFAENSRLMLYKTFKNSSNLIKVHHTKPILCNTIHDLGKLNGGLVNNNILLHKEGFSKLNYKVNNKYYKVYDYLFNDDFEPIGLKLLDNNGDIVEVTTKITDEFVERGIEGVYAKVGVYTLEDETLKTEFLQLMNKRYSECAICGMIASLKKTGICWQCSGRLFRLAVSNGDKIEFEDNKLMTTKTKIGFTTFIYKYEVGFTETTMKFKECEWCWKGKEQYLPYDWWA
jgi:hypothetical protein